MLEFLQELFGTGEDGQPKALTYDQLEKAAASAKDIKAVNLASGGYVSKDKFDAKNTELEGVEKQLKDANATIKSYKDMDIDGIKKSVSDWQTKYETDTKTLKDQLAKQERNSARDLYFSRVDFASKAAKAGMMAEFDQKNFRLVDGKFEGADAWLEEQRKSDPASFKQKEEKKPEEQAGTGNPQNRPPQITTGTNSGAASNAHNVFGFNFVGVRKHPADN